MINFENGQGYMKNYRDDERKNRVKLKLFFMMLILVVAASCAFEASIPLDRSMAAIQDAGYSLTVLNVSDMRCFQGR